MSPKILDSFIESLDDLIHQHVIHDRTLIRFSHPVIAQVVANKYLDGAYQAPTKANLVSKWTQAHKELAEYFMGTWATKPKSYSIVGVGGQEISQSELRCVPQQPSLFTGVGGKQPNIRKTDELGYHLLRARLVKDFVAHLTNMEFMTAKVMAGGLSDMQAMLGESVYIILDEAPNLLEPVQNWRRFLSRHAAALSRYPASLLQQAVNEPRRSEFQRDAAKLLEAHGSFYLDWINRPAVVNPCIITLTGHSKTVTGCCVGGVSLLSSSHDGTLRVWDLKGGAEQHRIPAHAAQVTCCAITADGVNAISGSVDKTVCLWDLSVPSSVDVFAGHQREVRCCALSGDGSLAASADASETGLTGSVFLWNTETFSVVYELQLQGKYPTAVALSNGIDRPMVLVVGTSDGQLMMYDAKPTGLVKPLLVIDTGSKVRTCDISPDSTMLVSGHVTGSVRVWSFAGKPLLTLDHSTQSEESVNGVGFSPSGKRVVSGGQDKTVRVWDTKTGSLLHVFEGHKSAVESAVFGPNDDRVISSSRDYTIKIWDAKSSGTAVAPDASTTTHSKAITRCSLSLSGSTLATASADRTAVLWDTASVTPRVTIRKHEKQVVDVKISPDGHVVATASEDRSVLFWDTEGQLLDILNNHSSEIVNCGFSRNAQRMASIDKSHTLIVWDVKTGVSQKSIDVINTSTSCVFVPHEDLVIVGHANGSLTVWDVNSGQCVATYNIHRAQITTLQFSASGLALVSASLDRTAKVWLWDSQKRSIRLCAVLPHDNAVTDCCFTPEGFVLTAAGGYSVSDDDIKDTGSTALRIWDVKPPNTSRPLLSTGSSSNVLTPNNDANREDDSAEGSANVVLVFNAPSVLQSVASAGDLIVAGCKRGRVFVLRPSFSGTMSGLLDQRQSVAAAASSMASVF